MRHFYPTNRIVERKTVLFQSTPFVYANEATVQIAYRSSLYCSTTQLLPLFNLSPINVKLHIKFPFIDGTVEPLSIDFENGGYLHVEGTFSPILIVHKPIC